MRRKMVPLRVSNVKVVSTNLNKAKALVVYVQMAQRRWKMEQYLDLSVLDVLLGRQVMPVAWCVFHVQRATTQGPGHRDVKFVP